MAVGSVGLEKNATVRLTKRDWRGGERSLHEGRKGEREEGSERVSGGNGFDFGAAAVTHSE